MAVLLGIATIPEYVAAVTLMLKASVSNCPPPVPVLPLSLVVIANIARPV